MLKNAGCKVNLETKGSLVDQNLETTIEGIFSTGNVLHVHDLVDFVSEESERAGKNAARYILNKRGKILNTLNVKHSENVSYVLPSIIKVYENNEPIIFSFRVKKPIKKANICIKNSAKTLLNMKKMNLLPAEMIKITAKDLDLKNSDDLVLEVKEDE